MKKFWEFSKTEEDVINELLEELDINVDMADMPEDPFYDPWED